LPSGTAFRALCISSLCCKLCGAVRVDLIGILVVSETGRFGGALPNSRVRVLFFSGFHDSSGVEPPLVDPADCLSTRVVLKMLRLPGVSPVLRGACSDVFARVEALLGACRKKVLLYLLS